MFENSPRIRDFKEVNVLGLYAFLNVAESARLHLFGSQDPDPDQLEALIEQIQGFAMAGLRHARIQSRLAADTVDDKASVGQTP